MLFDAPTLFDGASEVVVLAIVEVVVGTTEVVVVGAAVVVATLSAPVVITRLPALELETAM